MRNFILTHKILLLILAAGLAIALAAGLILSFVRNRKIQEAEAPGIAALEAQQNRNLTEIISKIDMLTASDELEKEKNAEAQSEAALIASGHGTEDDLYDTMTVRQPDELRKTFAANRAVVFGDSMVEGINDGGYLASDSLVFKRGMGTYNCGDYLDQVIALAPKTVFLQFGLNDMDNFVSDSASFRKSYLNVVTKLKAALPDTQIYLNNINRVLEKTYDGHPGFLYLQDYNDAIRGIVQETGVHYIDNSSLIGSHDELFDTDGIHPFQSYYLSWLSHMAYEAGI